MPLLHTIIIFSTAGAPRRIDRPSLNKVAPGNNIIHIIARNRIIAALGSYRRVMPSATSRPRRMVGVVKWRRRGHENMLAQTHRHR